jgi:hypothetical protein
VLYLPKVLPSCSDIDKNRINAIDWQASSDSVLRYAAGLEVEGCLEPLMEILLF